MSLRLRSNKSSLVRLLALASLSVFAGVQACKEAEPVKIANQYEPRSDIDSGFNYEQVPENNVETKPTPETTVAPDPKIPDTPIAPVNPTRPAFDGTKVCHNFKANCTVPSKNVLASGAAEFTTISGSLWADTNKDGIKQNNEPRNLPNVIVYLDVNNNCQYDNADFPGVIDTKTGTYQISRRPKSIHNGVVKEWHPVPLGEMNVRLTHAFGQFSADGYIAYKVNLTATSLFSNVNFSLATFPLLDVGSAPPGYGAVSHEMGYNWYLGSKVGPGPDGNTCSQDGIVLPPNLKFNSVRYFSILTPRSGSYLNGWIDLNGDGDFLDADEHFIGGDNAYGRAVAFTGGEGLQIEVYIPANPTNKTSFETWTRFRLGEASLGSSGHAQVGETEDYKITISN